MTGSSIAGIITAFATVLIAVGGIITAVGVLLPILRTSKDTHKIVNQQRTDMQRYQAVLVRALNEAGIAIPIDQSIDTREQPPHT